MILTLELGGTVKPGVAARKVFTESGGTIGRDAKSFWVLPDGEVSGRHALISCRNGVFFIEDTNSTNGIAINSVEDRLVPSRRYPLTSGDRIFIRPYVITVDIAAAESQPVRLVDVPGVPLASGNPFDVGDPFRPDDPFAPAGEPLLRNDLYPTPPAADGGEELNPLNLIPGGRPRLPRKPGVQSLSGGSLLESNYRPPDVSPEPPLPTPAPPEPQRMDIPHGYDPIQDDSGAIPVAPPRPARPRAPIVQVPDDDFVLAPPPIAHSAPPPPAITPIIGDAEKTAPAEPLIAAPVPARSGASSASGIRTQDLQAVLEGAGLDGSLPTDELERMFGEILRVVVSGVMEMLRARQEIKDEFRMHLTQFRPTENNPLKFSANVEDALHNLLVKRNAAYLGPVEAFTEAFEDLRHHQIAMLEGMRAAFEAMLEEFDPDALQKDFDRQGKSGALLSVPAKLRYWEMYRERCRDLVQDKDTTFRKLFGEEFAQAYDVQLRRLKAASRTPKE